MIAIGHHKRQPIRVAKRFFHTCENRFVQSARVCVYIPANSFTIGKVFGEDFFKLPAISSGFKSLLRLNWTSWAISHVYKDLQCYENQKICFWKRNIYKREARQLY